MQTRRPGRAEGATDAGEFEQYASLEMAFCPPLYRPVVHLSPPLTACRRGDREGRKELQMLGSSSNMPLLIPLLLLSLLQACAVADTKAKLNSYIVYLGGHSHGAQASLADYQAATNNHHMLLGSFLGSKEKSQESMIYSYTKSINGFAAHLDEDQAKEISKSPNVICVFPNTVRKLHTTKSWDFLGLEDNNGVVALGSIWKKARYGEDVIIASIDTGVWPESKSFNDKGMGPVPSRWKGYCEQVDNPKDMVKCNRKLIGARHFSLGRPPTDQYDSARDLDGHGSHTLSTAGGRFVPDASLFGIANGTAKGGSPAARVAAYKVCTENGCYDADILAAFEAAIEDGPDVISVSLGGMGDDYFTNSIAIGSFHAVARGIPVVCSGGNDGPMSSTVSNVAPWILTVAAGYAGRQFISRVSLGNKRHLQGWSLASKHQPPRKYFPIIDAGQTPMSGTTPEQAKLCATGSLDPNKVKGKIVVCVRGDSSRMEKAEEVSRACGVGMILANTDDYGEDLIADPYMIPGVHIGYAAASTIYSYLNSTRSPVGHIGTPKAHYGLKPAPFVAEFSSRGPNFVTPQILKPDILAPGVDILAAYSQAVPPSQNRFDTRRVAFNILSGTSMACPHVSGVVGLLKALHPDWSPAALRSAIMTTARTRDNTGKAIKDSFLKKSNPFGYGAGHIQPNHAVDPGLVYDLNINDYLNFLCTMGYNSTKMAEFANKTFVCPPQHIDINDLNYPSITVHNLSTPTTVSRTLKNVGTPGIYRVRFKAPPGISVLVNPDTLKFDRLGEEKTYKITFAKERPSKDYVFGQLIWYDGKHNVRSPLVVKAG